MVFVSQRWSQLLVAKAALIILIIVCALVISRVGTTVDRSSAGHEQRRWPRQCFCVFKAPRAVALP